MASVELSFREEISKLMGQGKRHLVCNEVVQAVKCFEEAAQKLDTKHGPGADECGQAYLFYGKALLELARAENGVIGNALKDVEPSSGESSDEDEEDKMGTVGPKIDEMSSSDKEKIREDVQDAMAEEEEGAKAEDKAKQGKDQENKEGSMDKSDEGTSKTKVEGKDESEQGNKIEEAAPKEEADVEMKEEKANDNEDAQEAENKGKEDNDGEEGESEDVGEEGGEEGGESGGEGTTTEGQEEDADADVPTMQLAWESLVLARVVFLRREKEAHLDLAEVHLKLGEIQLEQEQFVGAVTDFLKCLELQQKHLEPDDRLIAETAYHIGLAYSLQPNYTKAKEFYSKALGVIELKISKLETRLAESKDKGKGKATDDDQCVVDRKELEELQNLYPDIKARVDEAQEMINSTGNQSESTTEEGFGSTEQDKSNVPVNTIPIKKVASQQPVNDVSHLIRRKRKPEEESSSAETGDTEVPLKKARQDEDPQTAAVVTENGHTQN